LVKDAIELGLDFFAVRPAKRPPIDYNHFRAGIPLPAFGTKEADGLALLWPSQLFLVIFLSHLTHILFAGRHLQYADSLLHTLTSDSFVLSEEPFERYVVLAKTRQKVSENADNPVKCCES
jgi:hypothetical protein